MSEYKRINCKCGHSYLTKDYISNCPECRKTNYTAGGGLIMIIIIAALVIFVALLVGAPIWIYYTYKNKGSYLHYLGASALAGCSIAVMYQMSQDEYPGLGYTGLIINFIAIISGIYLFIKSYKSGKST